MTRFLHFTGKLPFVRRTVLLDLKWLYETISQGDFPKGIAFSAQFSGMSTIEEEEENDFSCR